jgi:hypothetical protein
MNPGELANECAAAIKRAGEQGIKPFLRLTLPRWSRGRRHMVVFPKPRLMGEVLCETGDEKSPRTVVLVDPIQVLAWLASQGLVKVEVMR